MFTTSAVEIFAASGRTHNIKWLFGSTQVILAFVACLIIGNNLRRTGWVHKFGMIASVLCVADPLVHIDNVFSGIAGGANIVLTFFGIALLIRKMIRMAEDGNDAETVESTQNATFMLILAWGSQIACFATRLVT